MISHRFILFASVATAVVFASPAMAQPGGIEAEFAGAGARPLSMGGAFLALADDSTAAEFNPAGIRVLRRPELAWQLTRTYDRRENFLPDTSSALGTGVRGSDTNQWTTPSFISYVHPGQKFTWAVSQLTTIDYTNRFEENVQGTSIVRELDITNNAFGVTFAKDLKPRLHVGVTFRMNRYDLLFVERVVGFSSLGERIGITDWSPSVNLGILWRATKDWSFGAVYKSPQRIRHPDIHNTELPETFGVGVAYHPNDKLRVLADIDYIPWSEFDSIPNDAFRRQDVTRFHLGAEYLFHLTDEEAWFVRGGYMREESNALFYDPGLVKAGAKGRADPIREEGFPKEDDIDHLSFGIGVAKETYQLDLGVDHAIDGETVLILSMIHYF